MWQYSENSPQHQAPISQLETGAWWRWNADILCPSNHAIFSWAQYSRTCLVHSWHPIWELTQPSLKPVVREKAYGAPENALCAIFFPFAYLSYLRRENLVNACCAPAYRLSLKSRVFQCRKTSAMVESLGSQEGQKGRRGSAMSKVATTAFLFQYLLLLFNSKRERVPNKSLEPLLAVLLGATPPLNEKTFLWPSRKDL